MRLISNIINKAPNNFLLIQAKGGFFGSLVYRIIAGSSSKFVWKREFCGCNEELGPLEWPKFTEGFNIYELSKNRTYSWFKENHLTTAHISHELLEYSKPEDIVKNFDKKKTLILKTHNMDLHPKFSCKIVRVVGSIKNITELTGKATTVRKHYDVTIPSVEQHNLYNLNIENLMSTDFSIFIDEYSHLCNFLDIPYNINNVRQFILLLRDKLERYKLTLP